MNTDFRNKRHIEIDHYTRTFQSKGTPTEPGMKMAVIFLSIALMLAGASFLPLTYQKAYSKSTSHNPSTLIEPEETALPHLQGEEAVEHLRKQGLYSSLQEAMTAARYRVYADDQGKSDYYADNPALRMGMRFDDGAMRLMVKRPVAQSKAERNKDRRREAPLKSKPRYRVTELSLRLIGAGYGNRILQTAANPEMSAEANRFTYQHHLENSAISHQGSRGAGEQGSRDSITPAPRNRGRRPDPPHLCMFSRITHHA
ncbi:MAG: hypothetical protein L0229_16250 [Blastocatellia bacterium]|nr:hypothetical protein [Blastocatellia bacterium]